MTTQPGPQQQAIFPSLPTTKMVDQMGNMNYEWRLFFQTLVMALQTNLKPEGFVIPQLPTTLIAALTDVEKSTGNIIYDSTVNVFKGDIFNTSDGTNVNTPEGAQHWLSFAMMTTFAGNPNGNVPGFLTQLCLNTTSNILYVCTRAGQALNVSHPLLQAVWTALN